MKRIIIAFALCVAQSVARADVYVVPVVTARLEGLTYSTTTGFRNDSPLDVECTGRFVRGDGRVVSPSYTIKAATQRVEPDTLIEHRPVGAMRLECSGPLAIASRIQASRDDGLTFDAGSVYAAQSEADAVTPRAPRTVRTDADLLALEPDGRKTSFTIVVKDAAGQVAGRQRYELPGYAPQYVMVAALLAELGQARIEVHVSTGRVLVLKRSSDRLLAALAPAVTHEQRILAARSRTAQSAAAAGAPARQPLLLCPFKAAPFRDPGTGLCFMRDRWYDPDTGTFLTPDRSGYIDSSNAYAFARNDPVNRSDPTGRVVETAWDAFSLGLGGVSLYHNVREGNYGWAALDTLGIAVDTAAVLTPFVPGGVGAALKASRATGLLGKAQLIDQSINVGQGAVQAFREYRDGNVGWGTLYTGMAALGVRGIDASQLRLRPGRSPIGGAPANLSVSRSAHALEAWTPAEVIAYTQQLGLTTPRNSFLVWSGLGRDGIARSQAYAREFGGVTLEMTRGGRWLNEMNLYGEFSPFSRLEADEIWSAVSRSAASQASGQVRALLGHVRPSSIYHQDELPTLLANPDVIGIEPVFLRSRYMLGGWRP